MQKEITKQIWKAFANKDETTQKFKLKNRGAIILDLKTGCGKTVIALYMMSKLKLKTLIVVHQEQLYL